MSLKFQVKRKGEDLTEDRRRDWWEVLLLGISGHLGGRGYQF
jgi:hypothetical protein